MDQDCNPLSVGLDADNALTEQLERQRARADQFFAQERLRMEAIEVAILQQFSQLAAQVVQLQDGADLAADLAAVEEELQRRREALTSVDSEFTNAQYELNVVRAELEERSNELHQKQDRLARDQEALEQEKEATRQQRTRIAHQLKQRRAEIVEELDQRREQIEQLNSDASQESSNAIIDDRDAIARERDQLQQQLTELQSETRQLKDKLADAESQPTHDRSTSDEELQRRLDQALQEAQQLQQQNAELQQAMQEDLSAELATDDSYLDWEAQKKRLLNSLDGGDSPALDDTQRFELEEKIRACDKVVAAKDRQIQQLQEEQERRKAAAVPPEQTPAPESSPEIDADEMVKEELGRLEQLQSSLRETMREAEVEISLERAKLAREKVAVEEKLADMELIIEKRISELQAKNGGTIRGKTTSRWRTRLGLDNDDE